MRGSGSWPRRSRAATSSSDSFGGPYPSARAVAAPTRITSVSARRAWKRALSPGPPSPPERPSTVVAPSALATMFNRNPGLPSAVGGSP